LHSARAGFLALHFNLKAMPAVNFGMVNALIEKLWYGKRLD
jgi:hypothetical protein